MSGKTTTRSSHLEYRPAPRSVLSDDSILPAKWTRAQCSAIEWGVGGGFLLLAVLGCTIVIAAGMILQKRRKAVR